MGSSENTLVEPHHAPVRPNLINCERWSVWAEEGSRYARTKDDSVYGWWFGSRLRYGDKRRARVGTTHSIGQGLVPCLCDRGFHASRWVRDALHHNKGIEQPLYVVALWGEIHEVSDKLCAQHREYLVRIPFEAWFRAGGSFNAADRQEIELRFIELAKRFNKRRLRHPHRLQKLLEKDVVRVKG